MCNFIMLHSNGLCSFVVTQCLFIVKVTLTHPPCGLGAALLGRTTPCWWLAARHRRSPLPAAPSRTWSRVVALRGTADTLLDAASYSPRGVRRPLRRAWPGAHTSSKLEFGLWLVTA